MSRYPQEASVDPSGLGYATFYFDHRIYRYFFLAGLTILIYDHLLTLGTEAKYIWSGRLRRSTSWFLAVRYIGLAASITISVFYFGDLSHELQMSWEALLVLQEVLIECTLFMRVFAMYGLNIWILICLLSAGGVSASLALWAIAKYGRPQMLSAPGLSGCHTAIPRSSAFRLAGGWEAQLVCDTLVFALTVRRAYVQRISALYTGGMYFGIIVIANLANILTFYIGDVGPTGVIPHRTHMHVQHTGSALRTFILVHDQPLCDGTLAIDAKSACGSA
ncbi:hypothetical protein MVEN_02252000 [Mycena venus]|uniref:DUF6533 domain-containing protein n=1 Tax=Mycena venus TaxID=2733690 RepID=A0A8H6X622_9AGAR|nr:hypothetical protein MVEN_02252000 [Mycena venus]